MVLSLSSPVAGDRVTVSSAKAKIGRLTLSVKAGDEVLMSSVKAGSRAMSCAKAVGGSRNQHGWQKLSGGSGSPTTFSSQSWPFRAPLHRLVMAGGPECPFMSFAGKLK